jgi:hypothetical protein
MENSSVLQDFKVFNKFDSAFQRSIMDEESLRILFGNLYTEVSDSNLKLPDDAKLI